MAVSDAFNAAGFGYAAFITHGNGRTDGAIGFGLVALAAAVGVLRCVPGGAAHRPPLALPEGAANPHLGVAPAPSPKLWT